MGVAHELPARLLGVCKISVALIQPLFLVVCRLFSVVCNFLFFVCYLLFISLLFFACSARPVLGSLPLSEPKAQLRSLSPKLPPA